MLGLPPVVVVALALVVVDLALERVFVAFGGTVVVVDSSSF